MEKNFIEARELMSLKFYGITIRLHVIFLDCKAHLWFVTVRGCNGRDDQTWEFYDFATAKVKFNEIVKETL